MLHFFRFTRKIQFSNLNFLAAMSSAPQNESLLLVGFVVGLRMTQVSTNPIQICDRTTKKTAV